MIDLLPIHSNPEANISYQHIGRTDITRFEKMHVEVFSDSGTASIAVAREIADLIREKAAKSETCVLGLATGSSPIKVYEELVRLHQEEGLSFKNVITFNLDEYYPMARNNAQSYWSFMHEHLFDEVDIPPENINIPDGTLPLNEVYSACMAYEEKISQYGGLDFQLLGIGRTGHIGFNEPGSSNQSLTRLITLDHLTRVDASGDFHGIDKVPKRAITMGINTIKKARRIILLAWGYKKADIVKETVEGEVSSAIPATFLQEQPNASILLDEEASAELTRFDRPAADRQAPSAGRQADQGRRRGPR
ncbi:MAG: glucosamine-6-phosphate deaminase, partial [Bacteroidota bacterium]